MLTYHARLSPSARTDLMCMHFSAWTMQGVMRPRCLGPKSTCPFRFQCGGWRYAYAFGFGALADGYAESGQDRKLGDRDEDRGTDACFLTPSVK